MAFTLAEKTFLQGSSCMRYTDKNYSMHILLLENITFSIINSGTVGLNLSFLNNLNTMNLTRNIVYLFARGGKSGKTTACCSPLIGLLI